MKGLLRWWNGMPVAGRSVVGLAGGGLVFAAVGLSVDWTSGAVVAGILLGAVVLFVLVRALVMAFERRRGQGLSAKLWSRMSSGEGGGLDATSEELTIRQDLQRRWRDVHVTLKERRYDYYSFPWYLIIGAAQSGKTTTIQQSNQEFPIGAEPVVDYGGTKGCNWFFTNKAILIDTAGRYVEHLGEDDAGWDTMLKRDQEEWETFLKLLKEERGRSPINGVIVTVKLEDLLETDPRRQKKIQDALRKALIHIEEQLEIRVPVYVLVTMMDLLVGFVDFFSNLPGLSDRSLFGWSRGGPFDKPFEPKQFEPAFAKLADRVDSLLLEFLEARAGRGDVREDAARIDRMTAFPDEFRSLGAPLVALLEALFKKSAYNEQHFFRGVYFTSGRQEGRPVMNACLSLVGEGAGAMQEEDVAVSSGGGNKAYFIADLYEEKVFHEAGLVRMTKRASVAQRLRKRAYVGVAAVLALAAALWVTQGVIRFQENPVFDPAALTALAERDFARADLEAGSPALFAADGLQGVADYLGVLDSPDFRDASVLASRPIDETSDALRAAFRKLWAEKVFAVLLDDFLSEQDAHPVDDWRRGIDLTGVLVTLRGLARDGALDVEGMSARLLPTMRALHLQVVEPGTTPLAYDQIAALARALGDGGATAPLADVRAVVQRRQDAVLGLLRRGVTGFWTSWLDALADPLNARCASAPGVEDVDPAWWWLRLRAFDVAAREEAERLTRVLHDVPAAVRDPSQFERDCVQPWDTAFARLAALRAGLDAHLRTAGAMRAAPRRAFEGLEQEFAPLKRVYDEGGTTQAELDLQRGVLAVRDRLQAAGAELESWSQQTRDGVVSVASQGRGPGALDAAVDKVGDALGADPAGWTFGNRLDVAAWRRLEQLDDLVSHDTAHDPILDPGAAEFWTLRGAPALAAWLSGPPTPAGDLPDAGRTVRGLLDAASDKATLEELRRQRRAAFFGAFRAKVADEPRRAEFLARVDVSRFGRTLVGSFPVELYGHRANADVAQALAEVCRTLRGAADTAELRELADALYLQYLASVFVPFWTGGLIDVARGLQLVPDAPPDTVEALRAWHDGLPVSARGLEGGALLARFAGAQTAPLDDALGDIPGARERVRAARELWERYRPEAGRGDDADVERVRGMAAALAAAFDALAHRPQGESRYELLREVRPATKAYDALMAPARVQHEITRGGAAPDPIVQALAERARPVRVGLGRVASALFAEHWTALGPAGDGPGAPLVGRFPFARERPAEADDGWLVGREEAARFFSDPRFRELAEVVAPHLQPTGPTSPSLYDLDFPEPAATHRDVFRRCVALRDLCGFAPGGEDRRVRVELFDSLGIAEGHVDANWSNRWAFDLAQKLPDDSVVLTLPFLATPKVGDKAPVWTPAKGSRVSIRDARADAPQKQDQWEYEEPFTARTPGGHWTDLLLFAYANARAKPSEVDNPTDGPASGRSDVRWLRLTFKRVSVTSVKTEGGRVVKVLGVRMEGMPDELPDLRAVWKAP